MASEGIQALATCHPYILRPAHCQLLALPSLVLQAFNSSCKRKLEGVWEVRGAGGGKEKAWLEALLLPRSPISALKVWGFPLGGHTAASQVMDPLRRSPAQVALERRLRVAPVAGANLRQVSSPQRLPSHGDWWMRSHGHQFQRFCQPNTMHFYIE